MNLMNKRGILHHNKPNPTSSKMQYKEFECIHTTMWVYKCVQYSYASYDIFIQKNHR